MLEKLDFPVLFLQTWKNFVSTQSRIFKSNGCYSEPIQVTRGFGQGDSMSIVPLLILGHFIGCFMTKFDSTVECSCYADNISLINDQVGGLLQSATQLIQLLKSLGLKVDLSKCVMWASSSVHRHALIKAKTALFKDTPVVSTVQALGAQRVLRTALNWFKLDAMKAKED